jgi:hypothetical protein
MSTDCINEQHAQGASAIDALIGVVEEAEQALEERARRERQETQVAAKAHLVERMGELWKLFEPYITAERVYNDSVIIHIDAGALGLRPFMVESKLKSAKDAASVSLKRDAYGWGPHLSTTPNHYELGSFFRGLRKEYPEYRKNRMGWAIGKLINPNDRASSREDAQEALDALLRIEPARREQWEGYFAEWETWRAGEDERITRENEEQRRLEQEREQAARKYETAFRAYWTGTDEVKQRNRQKAAALQADLDEPFDVYELTYSVIGRDEDTGEKDVRTETVFVTSAEQVGDDRATFYNVITGDSRSRAVTRMHYFYPVSIGDRISVRPTERLDLAREVEVFVSAADISVYCSPLLRTDDVMARLDLEPLPERPPVPELLTEYKAREIRESVAGEDEHGDHSDW